MALALYEMKIVLARMLARVDLALAPGYRPRLVRRSITMAPSGGMPVVVTSLRRRDATSAPPSWTHRASTG